MKKTVVLLSLLIAFSGWSQSEASFFKKANAFFETYVNNGKVAYAKLHKDSKDLEDVLSLAKTISVSKEMTNTYQAFWINAYNLSVIKGVIDNYPTNSPLDNSGFFEKTKYDLAGTKITLNDIEHKLLRAQFEDPRFHFVLVCGAIGCPPLINKAYLPETLYKQLETQTKIALNGTFLKVDTKKKRVAVSQIMEWYKEDFRMNGTTEIDFINKYRTEKIPDNFKIRYFPYNWKVNEQ
ncbi:DUF547 domain-containing protein [Seonamhaeicola sp. MEBiC1930]|uniref:DUF547 domain-containing protein n=1 Tax=Seonamhaeicola sp. MEBiC01930 TaxID=2976768 RepID=UPI0032450AF2